jgi:UPF0716 protein FxsA
MPLILLILFLGIPLLELWVILRVGAVIGAWWTIVLLVVDSLFGAWLVQRSDRPSPTPAGQPARSPKAHSSSSAARCC